MLLNKTYLAIFHFQFLHFQFPFFPTPHSPYPAIAHADHTVFLSIAPQLPVPIPYGNVLADSAFPW